MSLTLAQRIKESVSVALQELASQEGYASYLGPNYDRLIAELSSLCGQNHCLLSSSGTSALELALRGAGIGKDDEVLLSAYDYPGNFWAIERIGARPVLVDVSPGSWNLDLGQLEHELANGDIKAVVASHLHGLKQDMQAIRGLCESSEVFLVEDNCQAFGIGKDGAASDASGDACILSFGGGKLVSCGRGGAVLCRDEKLAQKMKIAAGAGSGPNTMSELQCAVVCSQLHHLSELSQLVRAYFWRWAETIRADQVGYRDIGIPWLSHPAAGVYQAGILTPQAEAESTNSDALERLSSALQEKGIRAGQGFSGFHRRSKRRCRVSGNLVNCPQVVAGTFVFHHSVAMQERISANELARIVLNALGAFD